MTALVDDEPRVEEVEDRAGRTRWWFVLLLVAGTLGVASAAWQLVERIAYAKDPKAEQFCSFNEVLTCGSVYDAWQSSALGIPNTLIGLPVFAGFAFTALSALLGTRPARTYLATMLGLGVFMSAFVSWYLLASALAIGALCPFCIACGVAALSAGAALTRVAAAHEALGRGRTGRGLALLVESGADLVVWVGLAAILASVLTISVTV